MSEKLKYKKEESNMKSAVRRPGQAKTKAPDVNEEDIRALALAYAKYLNEHGLEPGDQIETTNIEELISREDKNRESGRRAGGRASRINDSHAGQENGSQTVKIEESRASRISGRRVSRAISLEEELRELIGNDMRRAAEPASGQAAVDTVNIGAEPAAMHGSINIDPEPAGKHAAVNIGAEPETNHAAVSISSDPAARNASVSSKTRQITDRSADSIDIFSLIENSSKRNGSNEGAHRSRYSSENSIEADGTNFISSANGNVNTAETVTGSAVSPETGEVRYSRKKKKAASAKKKAERKAKKAEKAAKGKKTAKNSRSGNPLAILLDMHDSAQDKGDETIAGIGKSFAKGSHSIVSSYRHSRRTIGLALLMITVVASGILILFDRFTVYEYAYNGKVLGYVSEQEEVTDVLEVAGRKLSQNNKGETEVRFTANQNVTFNLVDGRGKSTDDADVAVNKLIYMSDIETEAFGVYDGDRIVAIVKSAEDGEELLVRAMEKLSTPDSGMELVSSEYTNQLDVRSINVLLGSVMSNEDALEQMVNGGEMQTWHIVEEGETAEALAEEFGVEEINVYNEDNSEVAEDIEQGDRVCIHSTVEPVSVEMVETGRMRIVEEYETIKQESDEYYQGDSVVQQEGVDGIYIFEGTITKVGGEITDEKRTNEDEEPIREKQDKIIIVGTRERPKTAPTGTFQMPIKTYVVTSEFGGRWGRMHEGMDFGASTGTAIYAADGGTVTRATYYSGYGLCVDIDHENGRMTRYGHCSRLLVSAGDKVYQGQEIALVGNTGHSFGSHLHFEVRINGTPQNPRNYVTP